MFLINWYIFSYKVCLSLSLSLPHFKMVSFPYGDVFVCWKCRQNPNIPKNYFPPAPIGNVCPCYKNVKWQQCKNVPKQFHSTDRAIQIHLISNHFREEEAGKGKRAGPPPAEPQPPKITSTRTSRTTSTTTTNITSTIIQTLVPQVEMNYTINDIVRKIAVCFAKSKCTFVLPDISIFVMYKWDLGKGGHLDWFCIFTCLYLSHVYLFFILYKGDLVILGKGAASIAFGEQPVRLLPLAHVNNIYQHLNRNIINDQQTKRQRQILSTIYQHINNQHIINNQNPV